MITGSVAEAYERQTHESAKSVQNPFADEAGAHTEPRRSVSALESQIPQDNVHSAIKVVDEDTCGDDMNASDSMTSGYYRPLNHTRGKHSSGASTIVTKLGNDFDDRSQTLRDDATSYDRRGGKSRD